MFYLYFMGKDKMFIFLPISIHDTTLSLSPLENVQKNAEMSKEAGEFWF